MATLPRRLIVRLVQRGRSIYLGEPNDRYIATKVFRVTRSFRFDWLDRTRPTKPRLHALDQTVLWWPPSDDLGSGVAAYRVMIDDKLRTTTTATRLTLPELRGTHRIAVVAVDRAGNRSRPGTVLLKLS